MAVQILHKKITTTILNQKPDSHINSTEFMKALWTKFHLACNAPEDTIAIFMSHDSTLASVPDASEIFLSASFAITFATMIIALFFIIFYRTTLWSQIPLISATF